MTEQTLAQRYGKGMESLCRRKGIGKIVKQILATREARVGLRSSSGGEDDQFTHISVSPLPSSGGARIAPTR